MNVKLFALVALFALVIPTASAIGISPGSVAFDQMLRGGYAERTINVFNTQGVPMAFTVEKKGAIVSWMSFEQGETFVIPANGRQALTVIIQPPSDVENGQYEGSFVVTGAPSGGQVEGAGLVVSTAISIPVTVQITDVEVKKAVVTQIDVKDAEQGQPFAVSVFVRNEGNIRIAPLVKASLSAPDKSEVLRTQEYDKTEILPTTTREIAFGVPSDGLSVGQYVMDLKVYAFGGQLIGGGAPFVEVFEKGSLARKGDFVSLSGPVFADQNQLVKISAAFKNIGEIKTTAKFKGILYSVNEFGEGKQLQLVESDELEVEVGQTIDLDAFFTPKEAGKYSVKGYVIYGSKRTPDREAIVNVRAVIQQAQSGGEYLYAFLAIVGLIIILVVFRKQIIKAFGGEGKR